MIPYKNYEPPMKTLQNLMETLQNLSMPYENLTKALSKLTKSSKTFECFYCISRGAKRHGEKFECFTVYYAARSAAAKILSVSVCIWDGPVFIALSLCEEILAFLLRGPRWIERLVALVVRVGGFHPE